MASFLKDPIPHDEAVDYIAGKAAVPQSVYKKLLPELRARAVAITGIEALDVVQRVRDTIAELPAGGDWDELKKRIIGELGPYFEEDAAAARAELLLRMHGWQGYAAAQYRELEEMKDAFPYRQYLSSEDSRVRPTHAALHGVVLPADSPFWHNHTPPWEWGCRCDVVGLTEADAEDVKAADAAKELPEQRDFFDGARAAALESGRLTRGPDADFDVRTSRERGNENGFEWRPGEMRLPVEELKKRYDPDVWAEFETWARGQQLEDKGTTVWDWLGGRELEPSPAKKPKRKRVKKKAAKKVAEPKVPERKNPVSKAVKVSKGMKAEVRVPAEEVLAMIDLLHDGAGNLAEVPLMRAAASVTYAGVYQVREWRALGRAEPDFIKIKPNRPRGETKMTIAHELGHYLDHQALGDGIFDWASRRKKAEDGSPWGRFWKAIGDSSMQKEVGEAADRLSPQQVIYYLRQDEIWARAYAQWVAKRSGDAEMVGAIENIRANFGAFRQWTDEEFQPISEAIDEILKEAGMNPAEPKPTTNR